MKGQGESKQAICLTPLTLFLLHRMRKDNSGVWGHERSTMNILLLDHEMYWIESLARGLRMMSYAVFKARTASEAVKWLRCDRPFIDLVLTDCSIQILNHPEMVRAFREKSPGIQVVMMANHKAGNLELWSNCICPIHFIEKPFTVAELTNLIEALRIRT